MTMTSPLITKAVGTRRRLRRGREAEHVLEPAHKSLKRITHIEGTGENIGQGIRGHVLADGAVLA